jgi:hypothetical protein
MHIELWFLSIHPWCRPSIGVESREVALQVTSNSARELISFSESPVMAADTPAGFARLVEQMQSLGLVGSSSTASASAPAASASQKGKETAATPPPYSPLGDLFDRRLDATRSMGQQIIADARREMKTRKRRRHDRKVTCAQCARKADKGIKLFMCARCKYMRPFFSVGRYLTRCF